MKTPLSYLRLVVVGLLLLGAKQASAQTPLADGHADIGVAWDGTNSGSSRWDLHVHDETHDIEYAPGDALLVTLAGAYTTIPNTPAYTSLLGTAGSGIWILPKNQNTNLLFLGFGAEEIETNLFIGDQFKMSLTGVSGPGDFVVYDVDGFGNPSGVMSTRDGLTAADAITLNAGGHTHLNWSFSAPGDYTVTFQGSGTLVAGNEFTTSDSVDYFFHVEAVPEPSTMALAAVGIVAVALRASRRGA